MPDGDPVQMVHFMLNERIRIEPVLSERGSKLGRWSDSIERSRRGAGPIFPKRGTAKGDDGRNGRSGAPSGSLERRNGSGVSETEVALREEPRGCDRWRPGRKPEAGENRSNHGRPP